MRFLKKYSYLISVIFILLILALTMFYSSINDSITSDEVPHIAAGYSYVKTGDYRLNPEHPPLVKDLSGLALLPLKLAYPFDVWQSNNPVVNNQAKIGEKFIYKTANNNPDTILLLARLPIMLLSLVFAVLVFWWAKKLFGPKAGIFALILYAFDANIIAHSRFVTTDLGISMTLFLNLFVLYYFLKKPSWKMLLATAVTFFIALVTKFSVAILVPTYIIIIAMLVLRKGKEDKTTLLGGIFNKSWKKRFYSAFSAFAIFCIAGAVMMWGFYFFHTMNMPAQVQKDLIDQSLPRGGIIPDILKTMSDNPITKPLAQYGLGFSIVSGHVTGEHPAFAFGQISSEGWWWYYPATLAIKVAIPIYVFILLMLIYWRKLRHLDWFTEIYLWIIPAVLMVMGMIGHIDIGIRYMLPIFPFIFISSSRLAVLIDFRDIFRKKIDCGTSLVTLFISVLLLWYIISSITTFPHYLSYFNETIGSYQNGYKYLTDSNVDWGQDAKRLAEWVKNSELSKEHRCNYQIYADLFSNNIPATYYIGKDNLINWRVQNGKPRGCFAISATSRFLQSSKLKDLKDRTFDYSWLDDEQPIANIGGSIFIYDLNTQ